MTQTIQTDQQANQVDRLANQADRQANKIDRDNNTADRLANYADREFHSQALSESRHKDLFIATVVHELRNPLAPIINSLSILETEFGETKALSVIERQVRKLDRLVNDLLDVARIKSGKLTLTLVPTCLYLLAKDVIANMSSNRIELRLNNTDIVINADANRLDQVLVNLLGNALRYTEDDGKIVVSVDKNETHAILSVSDDGVGIPKAIQNRIFDIYFQEDNKNAGSLGLGLFLCKSIVEGHNGKIAVESNPPTPGSTFTIHLPLTS